MSRLKFDTVRDRTAARPSCFPDLSYRRDAPHIWRIVDAAGYVVSRDYFSRAELLADLDRYASDYGYNP